MSDHKSKGDISHFMTTVIWCQIWHNVTRVFIDCFVAITQILANFELVSAHRWWLKLDQKSEFT